MDKQRQAAALRLRADEVRAVAHGVSPGEDRDYFQKLADALDAEALALEMAARSDVRFSIR